MTKINLKKWTTSTLSYSMMNRKTNILYEMSPNKNESLILSVISIICMLYVEHLSNVNLSLVMNEGDEGCKVPESSFTVVHFNG